MGKQEQETKKQAEAAEFPDDTSFDAGLDYDGIRTFDVVGGSEDFHYFMAAKKEDGSPQTVEAAEIAGYQVCTAEKPLHPAADRVLMRIPKKIFEGRREAKRKRRIAARKATMRPKGIPAEHLYELTEQGDRPGAREEWDGNDE